MTVTEYAKKYNVSKQSVYDKLKRGTLQYTVNKGIKQIILNDDLNSLNVKSKKPLKTVAKKKYKKLLKLLNNKNNIIKSLNDTIENNVNLLDSKQSEIETLNKSLGALILLIEEKSTKQIIHTVKPKTKKRKK